MLKKANYFECLCGISRSLAMVHDRGEVVHKIVDSIVTIMEVKAAALWLRRQDAYDAEHVASQGLSEAYTSLNRSLEPGIHECILRDGSFFSLDVTQDRRINQQEDLAREGVASLLVVPVNCQDRLIGALCLYSETPREFSEEEIQFVTVLAEQGGVAIENARLFEQYKKGVRLFFDLSVGLGARLDLERVVRIMTEELTKMLGLKAASVRILDKEGVDLRLIGSYGLSEKYLDKGRVKAEKSIQEALGGKTVYIRDASQDPSIQYQQEKHDEGIASILCVPIRAQEEVIGVLRVYSATPPRLQLRRHPSHYRHRPGRGVGHSEQHRNGGHWPRM